MNMLTRLSSSSASGCAPASRCTSSTCLAICSPWWGSGRGAAHAAEQVAGAGRNWPSWTRHEAAQERQAAKQHSINATRRRKSGTRRRQQQEQWRSQQQQQLWGQEPACMSRAAERSSLTMKIRSKRDRMVDWRSMFSCKQSREGGRACVHARGLHPQCRGTTRSGGR